DRHRHGRRRPGRGRGDARGEVPQPALRRRRRARPSDRAAAAAAAGDAVIYRRLASPLHATRASVASVWCLVLAAVALSFDHPIVLLALLLAVVGAGFAA